MRIAINTRLLLKNKLDGIGWFAFETLQRITKNHPEHQFYFIFDRPYDSSFIFHSNIEPVTCFPPSRHPFLWYLWFEQTLPRILKKIQPHIFVSPDGYLSLSTSVPSLSVIHDINFFHRPMDLPYLTRKYYNWFFPKYASFATRIATVSEFSKQDIVNSYHILPEKIDVVYDGANKIYSPVTETNKKLIREQLTSGADYFIFIGTLHPRKNINRLLLAFDEFRNRIQQVFKLVVVGEKMFMTSEIEKVYNTMKFREDVIFTGRLKPDELYGTLGAAFALTFIPLFEGFGIPVLEAMYCDVPVITSNVTSLPEVAGEAAVYADPQDIKSITEAMIKIYTNHELRHNLIQKAKIQREKFSWDLTAEKLWSSIEKCF